MKILIACEFSGIVRDAFAKRGHDAWSCDLLPTEKPGQHIQGDAIDAVNCGPKLAASSYPWDMVIAHPPCTYLANSGVRWLYGGKGRDRDEFRWKDMIKGCEFFAALWNACRNVGFVCFENPVMHGHAQTRISFLCAAPLGKQVKFIDPRDFGHMETKKTGLYLKNLPELSATKRVHSETTALSIGQRSRVHFESPGPDRWKNRSRTLTGIASAMAEQWGALKPL